MQEKLQKLAAWFQAHNKQVIAAAVIVLVLSAAFWYGGNAPGLQGMPGEDSSTAQSEVVDQHERTDRTEAQRNKDRDDAKKDRTEDAAADEEEEEKEPEQETPEDDMSAQQPARTEPSQPVDTQQAGSQIEERPGGTEGGMTVSEKIEAAAEAAAVSGGASVEQGSESYSEQQGMQIDPNTGKDKYQTDPVPEGKPVPVEPQDVTITDEEHTCTLSVRCDTILDNIGWLDPAKADLVPEDGVIFPETQVTFYQGESVFNVLQREMKKAGIQMEFENTPIYNSAYIEGINNLYEFDCGELSGWMYKVNDWFPNYGCSRYQLQEGDVVEWVYTCDLGVDVGGFNATR